MTGTKRRREDEDEPLSAPARSQHRTPDDPASGETSRRTFASSVGPTQSWPSLSDHPTQISSENDPRPSPEGSSATPESSDNTADVWPPLPDIQGRDLPAIPEGAPMAWDNKLARSSWGLIPNLSFLNNDNSVSCIAWFWGRLRPKPCPECAGKYWCFDDSPWRGDACAYCYRKGLKCDADSNDVPGPVIPSYGWDRNSGQYRRCLDGSAKLMPTPGPVVKKPIPAASSTSSQQVLSHRDQHPVHSSLISPERGVYAGSDGTKAPPTANQQEPDGVAPTCDTSIHPPSQTVSTEPPLPQDGPRQLEPIPETRIPTRNAADTGSTPPRPANSTGSTEQRLARDSDTWTGAGAQRDTDTDIQQTEWESRLERAHALKRVREMRSESWMLWRMAMETAASYGFTEEELDSGVAKAVGEAG